MNGADTSGSMSVTANTLPFYRHTGHTGRLDLPPGEYAVRIMASDFYGNSARRSSDPERSPELAELRFTEICPGTAFSRQIPACGGFGLAAFRGRSSAPDLTFQIWQRTDAGLTLASEFHKQNWAASRPRNFPDHPPETLLSGTRIAIRCLWALSGTKCALYSATLCVATAGLPLDIADRLELRKGDRTLDPAPDPPRTTCDRLPRWNAHIHPISVECLF
jgi:hypothetical protein